LQTYKQLQTNFVQGKKTGPSTRKHVLWPFRKTTWISRQQNKLWVSNVLPGQEVSICRKLFFQSNWGRDKYDTHHPSMHFYKCQPTASKQ